VNTTPYSISIAPAAHRQFANLSVKHRKLIFKFLEALAINPRPPGVKKIEGMTGLYSHDVDTLRIIFKVEDQDVLLLLIK
jgi:mRNA interferase RelE/StbE